MFVFMGHKPSKTEDKAGNEILHCAYLNSHVDSLSSPADYVVFLCISGRQLHKRKVAALMSTNADDDDNCVRVEFFDLSVAKATAGVALRVTCVAVHVRLSAFVRAPTLPKTRPWAWPARATVASPSSALIE